MKTEHYRGKNQHLFHLNQVIQVFYVNSHSLIVDQNFLSL